ncbi:glycosyltransferase [Chitinimonas sp.]|uniref:glycosyltransferase n=1 Tax=Chitinimonas sp. TaxID=1934313 RepID=UPI0035ADE18B
MADARLPAIIWLAWDKNASVLDRYLDELGPRVVATVGDFLNSRLRQVIAGRQSQAWVVGEQLDDASRALASRMRDQLLGPEQALAWRGIEAALAAAPGKTLAQLLEDVVSLDMQAWLLRVIQQLDALAASHPVELVVVNEDYMALAKLTVLWANARGIPSLHIEHNPSICLPFNMHKSQMAQKMAISGSHARENLEAAGYDGARLVETGLPQFDRLADAVRERAEHRRALCESLGLSDDGKPIILFCTTWSAPHSASMRQDIFQRSVAAYFRAIQQLGRRFHCVIKDRPATGPESADVLGGIARQIGLADAAWLYSNADPVQALAAADAVVAVNSGILLEAILCGVPAINLQTDSGAAYGPMLPADAGMAWEGADHLAAALLRLFDDQAWRERQLQRMASFAPRINAGAGGRAIEQIVALMRQMRLPAATIRPAPADSLEHYVEPWQQRFDRQRPPSLIERDALVQQWASLLAEGRAVRSVIEFVRGSWRGPDCLADATKLAQVCTVQLNDEQFWRLAGGERQLAGFAPGLPQAVDWQLAPESVDAVLFGDRFGTLDNIWGWLKALRPLLNRDARLYILVPNARNVLLLSELAEGRWPVDEASQLAVPRPWTRKELTRLLYNSDLHVERVDYFADPRLAAEAEAALGDTETRDVGIGRFSLANATPQERRELCAMALQLVASPAAVARDVLDYRQSAHVQKDDDYEVWLKLHTLSDVEAGLFEGLMAQWADHPRIEVFVYALGQSEKRLTRTVTSLSQQLYYNVTITVLSDQAAPDGLPLGERFRWGLLSGDPVGALNAAAAQSQADWLCAIEAGDELAPHAFLFALEAAQRHPAWRLMYSDEDRLDGDGHLRHPQFKPDFNLDLLRAQPYIGGMLLVDRQVFADLGGFDARLAGVEEYDLVLRAFEDLGSSAIGHLHDVLYHRASDGGHVRLEPQTLIERARQALAQHLARSEVAASISPGYFAGSFRLDYQVQGEPLVSLLMPVRDRFEAVQRAVESILEQTRYRNYELLILDNGSRDAATLAFLRGLDEMNLPNLRVYQSDEQQSLPVLYHALSEVAQGEVLVMLQPDIAVVDGDWLGHLLALAQRPEIGLVAPRLFNSRGRVRESARILGFNGPAGAAYSDMALDSAGYMGRAHLPQNVSAVRGGVVAIRRELFYAMEGFNAVGYPSDPELDLALRLARQGYRSLWTPFINLICDGMAAGDFLPPSAQAKDEQHRFYQEWLTQLGRDPAYNRNLQLGGDPFTMHPDVGLVWDTLPWRPLKRVLALPADHNGCGHYRLIMPLRTATRSGKLWGRIHRQHFSVTDLERLEFDSLLMQRQTTDEQLDILEDYAKYARPLLIYEIDDLITHVPSKSVHKADIPHDIAQRFGRGVRLADRFIVSTEPLAEAYRDLCPDIRVVKNRLEHAVWGDLVSQRRQGRKPRVGWAGGIGHTGDLELVVSVVKELAQEVDWVFFGMCPDAVRPFIAELHYGVPFDQYPAKLASMNLDLALAPLEVNAFNEAKSNLRLLEYGILGWPVICTDILPYQGAFPVTRLKNRHADWIRAIREHLSDHDELARRGDALRAHILGHWMLDDHLDEWVAAWT